MDKVNMSVAIIPMAQDFGWGPAVSGFIQAGFFIGYFFSQLPGGFITAVNGGRTILPIGVGAWSIATAAIPALAFSVPTLVGARACVGVGEAIAPSAATDMVSKILPVSERSGAIALIFGGLNLGTILGLLVGPYMIEHLGWPSVFFGFGALGLLWVVAWEALMKNLERQDPATHAILDSLRRGRRGGEAGGEGAPGGDASEKVTLRSTPFRGFLRSPPMWATLSAHVAHNYLLYNVLAWLPSYFVETQGQDLTHASQLALVPPVAGFLTSLAVGRLADSLVGRGVALNKVRKGAQAISFGGGASLLLLLSGVTGRSDVASTVLITAALAVSNFSYAGLYCSHQDMSARYSSLMLGWTNTWAALPGIFGISLTGVLLERTGSWSLALFYPTAAAMLLALGIYLRWGDSAQQDFEALHQEAFPWEAAAKEKLPGWATRVVWGDKAKAE